MKKIITSVFALLLLVGVAFGQTTTTSTTLSANVTSASDTLIKVTSATGFTAGSTYAFVDGEYMDVTGVSGTSISVRRGAASTIPRPHTSGATIYVGPVAVFKSWPSDPDGRCTSTEWEYLPIINVRTASVIRCTNSQWDVEQPQSRMVAGYNLNLDLQTSTDSKPVLINSRNYSTSGNNIGFQVKPAQNANGDGITGGEISPRLNSGYTLSGSIIGLHVDAYLKGTAVGTVSGDVRGLQIELVSDDAGTRTITGEVNAIRIRAAFSATAITGKFSAIRVEIPETQTNSKTYDYLLDLTGTGTAWSDTNTASGDTEAGFIRVRINGNARRIVTYSDET